MKKEYEDFLLKEYRNSRIAPTKVSVGKYDLPVPYAYANPMGDNRALKNALFDKYIKARLSEAQKYMKAGYKKIPVLCFQDIKIVKPFRLREKTDDEAQRLVTEAIVKRYGKAVKLTMALCEAYPDEKFAVRVDSESVRKMSAQYNRYLSESAKNKKSVSAIKVGKMLQEHGSLLYGTFKRISLPILQKMGQQYLKQLMALKRIYAKKRNIINRTLGMTALAGVLTLGTCRQQQTAQPSEGGEKTEFVKNQDGMLNGFISHIKNAGKNKRQGAAQSNSVVKLDENVQEFLAQQGLDTLNDVQQHNLNMFLKTRNARNMLIAFAENFEENTYDDKKGFLTIGYGCTNYLDEKGQPLEKYSKVSRKKSAFVQAGQETTKAEATVQVDRRSNFVTLPKLLKLVKVKLTEEQMIVTNDFAYITNDKFEETQYLQALNEKKPNSYLSQCMALWNNDAGLPKRLFVSHLILNGYLRPAIIRTFKPSSCYNLTLDECYDCKKNPDGSTKMVKLPVTTREVVRGRLRKVVRSQIRPDYKIKNGLPSFSTDKDNIKTCIASMQAKRGEQCVAHIIPSSTEVRLLSENHKANKSNSINNIQNNKSVREL